MHGILKEDLYQLNRLFKLDIYHLYDLETMKGVVDALTNQFELVAAKGTKFIQRHCVQSAGTTILHGIGPNFANSINLQTTWESEDGTITNKGVEWADRYLEQYEEKSERINIRGEEFSLVMYLSPSFANVTFYRKIGVLMGTKKRVLCLNDKNLHAWITIEENYNFTDNAEQIRFNKFLDTIKSFT